MVGSRDGGNVIHIIGGRGGPRDGSNNRDDQPGSSVGYGNGGATSGTALPPLLPLPPAAPLAPSASNSTLKPSWKTKICNKWERTGSCPYGIKCVFAHGEAELHRYGGGLVNDNASPNEQVNVVAATRSSVSVGGGSGLLPPPATRSSLYVNGGSGLLPPPTTPEKPVRKWKGPNKISRVYGDWIDED